MTKHSAPTESMRWDKVKNWSNLQDEIIQRLRTPEKFDQSITLHHGLQLFHTLRHPNVLKCMTHFTSSVGEIFMTHYVSGSINLFNAWTINSRDRESKCEVSRFETKHLMTVLLSVPSHRVLIGFCSDLTLKVFADSKSQCQEISGAKCPTTVLCIIYNRDTDELFMGGTGYLQRWRVVGSEHAATLKPGKHFETTLLRSDWITDIQIDIRSKQLLAMCGTGIYVINYETNKQINHLKNKYDSFFSCCTFYKGREYFITGAKNGTIKVWNAVVLTHVHEYFGHRDAITALQVHRSDPLLFSSSLDGSVQIWRLDNFQKFMRLDVGEMIYSMKLLSEGELYCQTLSEVKVYNLNQFYSLYAPVESTVFSLQRCTAGIKPTRVLVSTEDGSVRLISPVTSSTITISYPMPSFQVLRHFVFDEMNDRLYTLLSHGQVLIFDTGVNPCRPMKVYEPPSSDEQVMAMVPCYLTVSGKNGLVKDVLIFGGLCNGQIALLESDLFSMDHTLQAHEGLIKCMETVSTTCISADDIRFVETPQIIMSAATDKCIKFWFVEVDMKKKFIVTLVLNKTIHCGHIPKAISMYDNILCISCEEKRRLIMFHLEGFQLASRCESPPAGDLWHPSDEDHTEEVTAIDKCPHLKIFATAGKDGYMKIWDERNQLIRELNFGKPLFGMCFANDRGDLLVGFQNHVCFVSIINYLPIYYLEQISSFEFKDDVRETSLPYNHGNQLLCDPDQLPKFTSNLVLRRQIIATKKLSVGLYEPRKKSVFNEDVLLTPGTLSQHSSNKSSTDPFEIISCYRILLDKDYLQVPGLRINYTPDTMPGKLKKKGKKSRKSIVKFKVDDEAIEVYVGKSEDVIAESDSEQFMSSRMIIFTPDGDSLEEPIAAILRSPDISPEVALQLQSKKFIIAPDGYIPNSVIRALMGYKPKSDHNLKETWVPKPVPVADPTHLPKGWSLIKDQMMVSEMDREELFSWESDSESTSSIEKLSPVSHDEEIETRDDFEFTKPKTPPTVIGKISVTPTSPVSPLSRRLTPITPDLPKLTMKKFAVPKTDFKQDLVQRRRRHSVLVAEQKAQDDQQKSSLSPHGDMSVCETPNLIKELKGESWYPGGESSSIKHIMGVLHDMIRTTDRNSLEGATRYALAIHKEFGLSDEELNEIISGLLKRLEDTDSYIRKRCAWALGELKVSHNSVLLELLPKLVDIDPDVREESVVALEKMTGIKNKEGLMDMLQQMGVMKSFNSKDYEEAALQNLTEKLEPPFNNTMDRLELWVQGTQPGIYDDRSPSEEVVNTDEPAFASVIEKTSKKGKKGKVQIQIPQAEDDSGPSTQKRQNQRRASQTRGQPATKEGKAYISVGSKTGRRESILKKFPQKTNNIRGPRKEIDVGPWCSSPSQEARRVPHIEQPAIELTSEFDVGVSDDPKKATKRLTPKKAGMYRYYDKMASSTRAPAASPQKLVTNEPTNYLRAPNVSREISSEYSRVSDQDSDFPSSTLDPPSQIWGESEDVLTDNVSTYDSGIGRDLSDSSSHGRTGMSFPTRGHARMLSPVKSASGRESNSTETVSVPHWKKFFETPQAQERRYREIHRQDYIQSQLKPAVLPPISYVFDDVPTIQGEAGLRLLHTVNLGEKDREDGKDRHQVQPIPGKLSVHTLNEGGMSQFGILQMKWTTNVPCYARQSAKGRNHSHSFDTTGRYETTDEGLLPHLDKNPMIKVSTPKPSACESTAFREFLLPNIKRVNSEDYQWQRPIAPPPARESRTNIAYVKNEHEKYCQYYDLVKKKMHHFTSVDTCKPIPKAQSELSGHGFRLHHYVPSIASSSGILLPPIKWRQILSHV